MKILLILALAALAYGEGVKNVKQKYSDTTNTDLKNHIKKELQASYLYSAYAKYFGRADVALPGFAKFFSHASDEERSHADKLMKYINDRGGDLTLFDIQLKEVCDTISKDLKSLTFSFNQDDACICYFMADPKANQCLTSRDDWFNGLMAMEDTLVLERYVNSELLNIHKNNPDDPHLLDMLESDYLTEQVDAIKDISDKIQNLKRVKKGLGEYMFDKNLQ